MCPYRTTSSLRLAHLVAHSRALVGSVDLRELLVLPLPVSGIANTKTVLEDLADVLQRHALDLGEAEDDEQPADEADSGVEAECAGGSDALHHGQEGGRNDDISRPAGNGVQHGADCANLHGDQLSADPGNSSYSGAVESDEDDDDGDEEHARPANVVALDLEGVEIDRDIGEGNGGDDQADRHTKDGDQEDLAATEPIDDDQVDEREDEVGGRNGNGDSGGVVEADNLEQGSAVVHERVKAAELGNGHDCASSEDSTEGSHVGEDAGESLEDRVIDHSLSSLCDAHLDGVDLCAALLFGGGWVDACENDAGLIDLSMSDKLARRFRAQSEETSEEDGGCGTDTDCGPPCLRARATNFRESSTNSRSQELTECDRHVVEGDHTAAVLRRGQLGDIERNDHGCATNTKTNNKSTNSKLR